MEQKEEEEKEVVSGKSQRENGSDLNTLPPCMKLPKGYNNTFKKTEEKSGGEYDLNTV